MLARLPTGLALLLVAVVGAVALIYLSFGILTARETLGCDFLVYQAAAQDLLAGRPIYDLTIGSTGSCNLYYYPPPFVALALPFAFLSQTAGTLAWIAFLVACYVGACLVMPVSRETKLAIFLLGAVSWPFIFGVRIGQVGPILLVLFAIAWRRLDRPVLSGTAIGLGILVKLQPAVLLGWFVVRRMWSGLAGAVVTVIGVSLVTALLGLGGWGDMFSVLRNLESAVDQPANLSIGAMAYQHGVTLSSANVLQAIGTFLLLALVVVWGLRGSAEAGFLVAVLASQVVYPIVWTHYSLVALLPVAWLLDRRQWWAALIPLSQAWVLVPFTPIEIYAIGWLVLLVGVPIVDWQTEHAAPSSLEPAGA